MITKVLFNAVSASSNQTSDSVDFQQRAEWELAVTKTGTDGNPNLIIEVSVNSDDTVFAPLQNPETLLYIFPLDDSPIIILDDRIFAQAFRIRLEPNGTTTGTVSAKFGIKTYP